ncbi:O-succinylhomoserine sulfhydrylase [Marinobacter daqiaonensis]|uniref:O-succinylhomoserine sulfhydrylase n=1 Tax=Marinobacter daqiaonensis TaxID=650891 RepID=A0A1I6GUN3_9GAMM|nr:aminotransferase class I/II-fold pyridoxal phosphate-dependent enzyme [Marinobacter daqiaonensis]SFR45799.1 O-succinylhomoserine sulfhydrylase [Marinobacter daqiaonensis]
MPSHNNLTQALHCTRANGDDAHAAPIWMTSAYDFDSAEQASDRFNNLCPGNIYSRFTNPSVSDFERRLAILEHGEEAVGTASGMGAYLALAMAFLGQGDHVLLGAGMFGSTAHLFRQYLGQFGVESQTLPVGHTSLWAQSIRPNTRMLILETPLNPTMEVADIAALSVIARDNGVLLVVDNTVLSPICQQPLRFGADLVVQSAGKFIDGQGRCVGGALVGDSQRIQSVRGVLRSAGMCMSPFNAWVLAASLETLHARMRLHEINARQLCCWLERHPMVTAVHYTGLPGRPDETLIARQQTGHGALISVDIKGGQPAAWAFINALRLVARCTNIGDARTMVTHPWSTTHCRYTPDEKTASGIGPGLVRFSVGLEPPEDVIGDIEQALAQASQTQRKTA